MEEPTVRATCITVVSVGALYTLTSWLVVSGIGAVASGVVIVSALAQLDPVLEIYTWYSGAGAIGVIIMMTLTSAAVITFGSKNKDLADRAP